MTRFLKVFIALLPGVCALFVGTAKGAEVRNYFQAEGTNAHPKRVVLLPLTFAAGYPDEGWARTKLEPLVREKWQRMERFEVVTVSGDQLKRWTGKPEWLSEERLPPRLLERLESETGCDAVIFTHVLGFTAYPPLSLGWKMRMVTIAEAKTLWAVESWFDGKPERKIGSLFKNISLFDALEASGWKERNSPELLARNSLDKALLTLPYPQLILPKVSAKPADTQARVGANQQQPRLPAKEKKYGNQSEPATGTATADVGSGSVESPGEVAD
ncbi:MAG TPA: hypothetical protein VGH19_08600 [Verrucomicrobiae bacterium]